MADHQDQRSGDQSVNVQAHGNVTLGLSYSETKDLVQVTARDIAREEIERRMQELSDLAYERLRREKPNEAQQTVSSPDFQVALFDAQKGYARTGDVDLRDMLLNLLVIRVGTDDRSLLHAVLGEALVAAAKLMPVHFDVLTAIFLFRDVRLTGLTATSQLAAHFVQLLVPFIDSWPPTGPTLEYLQYTGCGSVEMGQIDTARLTRESYPELFPPPQDDPAVNAFLSSIHPAMATFVNGWNESNAKHFTLTVVGKAIAHSNLKRRTGLSADLTIWIQ